MPDYTVLAAELAKPAYTGLSDTAAAAALNAPTTVTVDRDTVPAYEVFEAIVPAEWTSLSAAEKQRVQTILSMGEVNLKGTNTRASLAASFGPTTTSRANLLALQTATIPSSIALALPGWGVPVTAADVAHARSLIL